MGGQQVVISVPPLPDAELSVVRNWVQHTGHGYRGLFTPGELLDELKRLLPVLVVADAACQTESGIPLGLALTQCNAAVPVLLIADAGEPHRIEQLVRASAADFILRPVAASEFNARARLLVDRNQRDARRPLRVGPLAIDVARREVRVDGRPVVLRRVEFDTLAYLARNSGRVVSCAEITARVLRGASANVTANQVHELRKKLAAFDCAKMITTVRGAGYVLDDATVPDAPSTESESR